jgi:hypothetical protein
VSATPVPIIAVLDRARGVDAEPLADDRRAVLREVVDRALGPLAGRATCDVEDLAYVFPTLGRSSRYELARSALPTISVGKRRLVSVPGLVALLLGVETDGGP